MQRRQFLWGLGAAGLAHAAPAAEVRVAIDPSKVIATIPGDFTGLGYEITSVSVKGLLSAGNQVYVQLVRNLGAEGVIRIGGITSDLAANAPASFDALGGFLRATGWKLIWGLNLGTGTPETASIQASAVALAAGDRLLCFQIGNEPDLYPRNGQRLPAYGYANYLAEFRRFADAVPGPLAGPDTANSPDWLASFARDEGRRVQFLTEHYYRGGAGSAAATIDNLLIGDPRFQTMMRQLPAGTRLCELNSFSGGGKPGVSDTFASTLWGLDLMFTLAAAGGGGINWETGLNQLGFVSSYSPIFQDDQGSFQARPLYYALLAFSMAGRGKLVGVEADAAGVNLRAYATVDLSGRLWVTLINKDAAANANVQLRVPASFTRGELFPLTAPAVDSKTGVRFAGTQVAPDGTWRAGRQYRFRIANGSVDVAIPSATAMVVRLA